MMHIWLSSILLMQWLISGEKHCLFYAVILDMDIIIIACQSGIQSGKVIHLQRLLEPGN